MMAHQNVSYFLEKYDSDRTKIEELNGNSRQFSSARLQVASGSEWIYAIKAGSLFFGATH